MIVQQRIVPQQGMDPMQPKMMMYLMPGVFTVMMLFLPAALGVYMLTNSVLGITQQLVVEKHRPAESPRRPGRPAESPSKKGTSLVKQVEGIDHAAAKAPASEREKLVSDMSTADRPSGANGDGIAAPGRRRRRGDARPADEGRSPSCACSSARCRWTSRSNIAPDDGEGSQDEIRLEIEGPDAGRIIGKEGTCSTPSSTSRRASRTARARPRRHVIVDAEGYRARHEDQLAQMARRLAQRVAAEGKVITFDPMSARERRIVHMALRTSRACAPRATAKGPSGACRSSPSRRKRPRGRTAPSAGSDALREPRRNDARQEGSATSCKWKLGDG